MIGLTVALPWKGYGSAIFLELGKLAPQTSSRQHHNEGEACISVEWDWRVEYGTIILYGSSNSRPEIESGIGSLRGTTIQGLSVAGQVPELTVRFSNGHCLRSMAMTTGDPEWSIKLLDEQWVYIKDGGLLVGNGTSDNNEQETAVFDIAQRTAARWGVPLAEPRRGVCMNCSSFISLDGDGHLLDYGVCIAVSGPFDGRIVNRNSGCPLFSNNKEA